MSPHPEVKWAQRLDKVYVTVQLPDSKNAKVELTPDGVFTFSANAGAQDNPYKLKLELFGKVNVEESKFNVGLGGIFCVVQKAEQGWWKRLLIAEGRPPHYVKVDLDKWVDEIDKGFGGDLDLGGMDFSKFGGMGDDAMGKDFDDSDDEDIMSAEIKINKSTFKEVMQNIIAEAKQAKVAAAVDMSAEASNDSYWFPEPERRKQKRKEKESCRHQDALPSPKRTCLTLGAGPCSVPSKIGNLLSVDMKYFDTANKEEVFSYLIELQTAALLLSRKMGAEWAKSCAEVTRLTTELTKTSFSLKVASVEKSQLNAHVKELEKCWSKADAELQAVKDQAAQTERRLRNDVRGLKRNLATSKEALISAQKEITDLRYSVVNEHEMGFEKGVRQAIYYARHDIPADQAKFDVKFDIHEGQFMSIYDIPDDELEGSESPATPRDNVTKD